VAKRIFNSLVHLYQIHSVAISCELREFFTRSSNNFIEFWDYPSCCNWGLHSIIDKVTEKFNLICCGNHLSQRQMITQAVNLLSWILSGKFTRELDKESLLN